MATTRGNTAYQFEPAVAPRRVQPTGPRPVPARKTQKAPKTRTRYHVRAGLTQRAKPIILLMGCCLVAVTLLMRNATISSNSTALHSIKNEIVTEQKTNNDLRLRLASEENLGRVMEQAAAMGMSYPAADQVRELQAPALAQASHPEEAAAQEQTQNEPSGVQKVLAALFAWLQ